MDQLVRWGPSAGPIYGPFASDPMEPLVDHVTIYVFSGLSKWKDSRAIPVSSTGLTILTPRWGVFGFPF